jgi:putative nucleotidyltransferase with HDIG domain
MREIVIKSLEESEANKLPSLPHILIKLLRACRDEDICFDTVSDIISKDAALSAKIVSVANSPVYGRARHLNSLKHTLMFLGLDTIKSIAITAAVQQFFSRYSSDKSQFLKAFWKHSLSCALIARSLAKLTSYKYVEEAYIAGLLHDIGKLVFESHAGFDYNRLSHGIYPAEKVLALEQQHFAITHDELGARLLENWDMTPVVYDAVRYHHAELEDIQEAHHLVKIINLANILASNNADAETETIALGCSARLFDLSEAIIRELTDEALAEVKKIAASLNIDIGTTETSEQDELKQVELAQEVRDIALVQSSKLPFEIAEGEAIFASIQKCLLILFGVSKSIVLSCDHDSGKLCITPPQLHGDDSILHELSIPLDSRSLASKALQEKAIVDSFAEDQGARLAVIDRQLISALQAEGLVCVPVIRAGIPLAVMVLGIRSKRYPSLLRNYNLLKIFAQEIADKIEQTERLSKQKNDILSLHNSRFASKAREIIHETNNPLSVIRNYLQILGNRLDNEDPAQEDLNTIKEEIDRVGNIILRCAENLDQADTGNNQPVRLNELITDIDKLFRSSLYVTHNIKSKTLLAEQLNQVYFDRDSIKQIVSNLVKNAVEAMHNRGELQISTRNVNINGKAFAEIEISDTGPGMPEHILKNIYTPVTSTKGKGHSGLGLSIVKNLIDGMGGYIACKTSNTGTSFTVQLPKNDKTEKL